MRVHCLVQRLCQFPVRASQNLESSHSGTPPEVSESGLGGRWVATQEGGGGEGRVYLRGHPVVRKYHTLRYGVMNIKMLMGEGGRGGSE